MSQHNVSQPGAKSQEAHGQPADPGATTGRWTEMDRGKAGDIERYRTRSNLDNLDHLDHLDPGRRSSIQIDLFKILVNSCHHVSSCLSLVNSCHVYQFVFERQVGMSAIGTFARQSLLSHVKSYLGSLDTQPLQLAIPAAARSLVLTMARVGRKAPWISIDGVRNQRAMTGHVQFQCGSHLAQTNSLTEICHNTFKQSLSKNT